MMSRRRTTWEVVSTGVLSIVCGLPVLIPAAAHLNAPWGAGDMTFYYFESWTWDWWRHKTTTQFGFPFGVDTNAFAGLDGLQYLFAQLVNEVAGNPFIGINLLLLLSFPVIAMGTYGLIRLTGLAGPVAIALATAFTFIPYHFGRGIGHLHLGLMFGLVSGMALVLLIGSGRLAWALEGRSGGRRIWYVLWLIALVIVSAWTGLYYAAFNVILVALAIIWRVAHGDSRRQILSAVGILGGLILVIFAGLASVLLSRGQAGDIGGVGLRDPLESVTYAGNLAITLVPQPYSILSESYNNFIFDLFKGAPANEAHLMANFGTWVTTAALVVALFGLVTQARNAALSGRLPRASNPPVINLTYVVYLAFTILLFFIPWGLNYFAASFITAQIRGWNRLEPYILLLFILGAAAALSMWKWPRHRLGAATASLIILLVAVVDMVLPWRNLYSYVPSDGQVKVDIAYAYAGEVNSALPPDCGILTLPYIPYPNTGPVRQMDDYDHFLVVLTNPERSISYGAYSGSPSAQFIEKLSGPTEVLQGRNLRANGFCGIHVDANGYEDPASILTTLRSQYGEPVAQEARWTMFAVR